MIYLLRPTLDGHGQGSRHPNKMSVGYVTRTGCGNGGRPDTGDGIAYAERHHAQETKRNEGGAEYPLQTQQLLQ